MFLLLLWLIWRLLGGRKQMGPAAPCEMSESRSGKLVMLGWHRVESTSIRAIGYDPEKYEVWVEFLTWPGPYVYFGVPPEVYDELEVGRIEGRLREQRDQDVSVRVSRALAN